MKKTLPVVQGIALLHLASMLSSSAATVSLGTAVPSVGDGVQNLNYSTSTSNNTNVAFVPSEYLAGDNGEELGQSFTTGANAGGYSLSSISVRQVSWGTTFWDYTGGTITLKVFSMNSVAGGIWNTTQLALESATVGGENDGIGFSSGTPGANARWLTVSLGTPLSLAANTQYGFLLQASGTAANDEFFMELDGTNTNSFAGGFALSASDINANPVWDGNNGQPTDRAFVATMTAIPEPASAVLAAFGVLTLLRRRR